MPYECAVCGTEWPAGLALTEPCPQCGSLQADVAASSRAESGMRFPQRKNTSRADRLQLQRERMTHDHGIQGVVEIFDSWEEFLAGRPVDVPFYTAPTGEAVAAILVTRQSIPHASLLTEIEQQRRPFALHVRAFLDASYPLLRMNLLIPDNPKDPLCLESCLDMRDGDAQDFIRAVRTGGSVDVVMAHEDAPSEIAVMPLVATPLLGLLEREAATVIHALPAASADADVTAARRKVEQVFRTAFDGLTPEFMVTLQRR